MPEWIKVSESFRAQATVNLCSIDDARLAAEGLAALSLPIVRELITEPTVLAAMSQDVLHLHEAFQMHAKSRVA